MKINLNNQIIHSVAPQDRIYFRHQYNSLTGRVNIPEGATGTIVSKDQGIYGIVIDTDIDHNNERGTENLTKGAQDVPYSNFLFIEAVTQTGQEILELYEKELREKNHLKNLFENDDITSFEMFMKTQDLKEIIQTYGDDLKLLRNENFTMYNDAHIHALFKNRLRNQFLIFLKEKIS